jgi:hypothetical protein
MEMTGYLYADSGEVERETMSGLEELKTRIRSTLLLFDPQTETGNVPAPRGGIGERYYFILSCVLTVYRMDFIR